jgi:DNA-binding ferritin-like protein (Dps family)
MAQDVNSSHFQLLLKSISSKSWKVSVVIIRMKVLGRVLAMLENKREQRGAQQGLPRERYRGLLE